MAEENEDFRQVLEDDHAPIGSTVAEMPVVGLENVNGHLLELSKSMRCMLLMRTMKTKS